MEVEAILRDYRSAYFKIISDIAPAPVVSTGGTRWMEVLALQYEMFRQKAPGLDACMLWDDDALFSPGALRELRGHLRCLCHDRVEVKSLFMWNHPHQYNEAFPEHWSACLFRVYPHDEWPTNFEVNCPRFCARSGRCARLTSPWLNFGYMDADQRRLTWEDQKAAGKIDAHTLCLVRPARCRPLPTEHCYRRSCC